MLPLVSSASAREADQYAEELGYPLGSLMEAAALGLQDEIEALEAAGAWRGAVVYLSGPGNNGGDALAMARLAHLRGRRVSVVRVHPPRSVLAKAQDALVRRLGVPVYDYPSPQALEALDAGLWVDGVWGTGLQGSLRPVEAQVIADLESRRAGRPVVAIDVPSGLGPEWRPGEPVITARWTLSPGWLKAFCFQPEARAVVGQPRVVAVSFPRPAPPSAHLLVESDLEFLVPPVAPSDHKGRRGHVAVVGGAPGMSGAAVLAARSAAAAGSGLVTLGVDSDLVGLVAPQVPAFQVRTAVDLVARVGRFDALVAGPGWGPGRESTLGTLWDLGLPTVLDADALAAWTALGKPRLGAPLVITPHPGEFRRLSPSEGLLVPRAQVLADQTGAVVVLKGAVTWILAPGGRRSVWDGANPALGTGGSGDCLAGVVGAFLAAGQDAYDAARAAVALHGVAGATLLRDEGWFTADRLPATLARVATCRMPRGKV